MPARSVVFCVFGIAVLIATVDARAATWVEVKSPHFTVLSDAGERRARDVAWQFEQIREALVRLWPWATSEFDRPIVVYAARDENSMRALVPKYFEGRDPIRPTSVFMSAPFGHFVAIRTDVDRGGDPNVNPYKSSYWSYVHLVLRASIDQDLPPWLGRGMAEVFSNTIVRENQVLVGPLIPWHLQALRDRGRPTIDVVLAADRSSPYLTSGNRMGIFDATAWALVHYLIFGNQGKNIPIFNQFAEAVRLGGAPNELVLKYFGGPTALREGLARYIDQSLFVYQRWDTAVGVNRASFSVRELLPADAAVAIARLHTASNRPADARAQLAAAGSAPAAAEVEAWLLDGEGKHDEAKAAYARASQAGAAGYYGEYRLASLSWPRADGATPEAFAAIEKNLRRSVELNASYAPAYSLLADALVRLNRPTEALGAAQRTATLDGRDPDNHLSVSRALWKLEKLHEARASAEKALDLATTENEQKNARQMLDFLAKLPAAPSAAAPAAPASSAPAVPAEEGQKLFADCYAGDSAACGKLQAITEQQCKAGDTRACMFLAFFYAEGRGVPKDETKAMKILEPLCNGSMPEACTPMGTILINRGGSANRARGRELLEKSCKAGIEQACKLLQTLK